MTFEERLERIGLENIKVRGVLLRNLRNSESFFYNLTINDVIYIVLNNTFEKENYYISALIASDKEKYIESIIEALGDFRDNDNKFILGDIWNTDFLKSYISFPIVHELINQYCQSKLSDIENLPTR